MKHIASKSILAGVATLLGLGLQAVPSFGQATPKVPTSALQEDEYTLYLLNFDNDKETVQNKPFMPFHGKVKMVPGKFGQAAEFDGSQLLVVPAYGADEIPKPGKKFQTTASGEAGQESYGNSLGLRLKDGQFTVECWIKMSPDTFTTKREQTIISFGMTSQLRVNPKGTITFYVPFNWKGHTHFLTGTKNVVDGNWHHVAAIVDNKDAVVHQIKLYIDGVRDEGETKVEAEQGMGFQAAAQNMPLPDHFFTVGGWRPHDATFAGVLDDLRVSFKARYPN
jgi:hypothetical protein